MNYLKLFVASALAFIIIGFPFQTFGMEQSDSDSYSIRRATLLPTSEASIELLIQEFSEKKAKIEKGKSNFSDEQLIFVIFQQEIENLKKGTAEKESRLLARIEHLQKEAEERERRAVNEQQAREAQLLARIKSLEQEAERENERLKAQLAESKVTGEENSRVIQGLREELQALRKAKEDKRRAIQDAKEKEQRAVYEQQAREAEERERKAEAERQFLLTIPLVARDHVEIYQRFLKGRLVYRPNKSEEGRIDLPIASLLNPLEGTFDLSRCGDTGKYLSISTGYRKRKIAENANKLEIWLAPRFLIEKEIEGDARHLKAIFPTKWPKEAPIGILWTWGGWDRMDWYDYVTKAAEAFEPSGNLYNMRLGAVRPTDLEDINRQRGFPRLLNFPAPFFFELK